MSYVQSYLSSITFPETLENAWRMEGVTNIDLLLEFDPNDVIWWTAPRWVQPGDIAFFYHTKSAKQQTEKFRKEAEQAHRLSRQEELYISQLLESAVDQANQYSGTIFGCAVSSGSSEYVEEHEGHFKTPFSAQMRNIHILESPLAYDDFKDSVQISQGPIKRLHKPQFETIKTLLKVQNELPEFLNNAEAAETDFPGVNQDNWPSISCVESRRFIDESHLRFCLLDWLLEEIKDSGTPVLKECRCLYRGK